jgi:peptidoglycan/LPS O-acetylase OafA/YrhL
VNYIPSLDGIRGAAVLLVLLYHARVPGFLGGLIGVDLFFVLSGYLITSLLIDEHAKSGTIALGRFWARRACRILPALVVFLAVGLLLTAFLAPADFSSQTLNAWYILTFSYNWIIAYVWQPSVGNLTLHCWSLAVEMQYYLIWPPILLFFLKRQGRGLPWFLGGMIVFSLALRIMLAVTGQPFDRIYFATDTRLDGLLLGTLLAHLMARPAAKFSVGPGAVAVALIGLAFLIGHDGFYDIRAQVADPLLAGLFSFAVIAYVAAHPASRTAKALSSRWLVWLGQISYGLYIWHYPFFKILRENLPWPQTLVWGSACSLACACVSYYLIERPYRGQTPISPTSLIGK